MEFKKFSHLSSFGFAGVEIPVKKIKALLASRLQMEIVKRLLKTEKSKGLSLAAIKEPRLEKLNYLEKTRGIVNQAWQAITDNLSATTPPQILERLNSAWNAAQKRISTAQENGRKLFSERAGLKAGVIREESSLLASEKGIPAVLGWMERLGEESATARAALEEDLKGYQRRRQRQKQNLEDLKAEWMELLGKTVDFDAHHTARNFLILAGIILLLGVGLWIFSIPAQSVIGIAGIAISTLIAMKFISPLFRHLNLSKKVKLLANKLLYGYKALSLFELDEGLKKLEIEYIGNSLKTLIGGIRDEYQKEAAHLEEIYTGLKNRVRELEGSLLETPPTIRPLVRNNAIEEWYEYGQRTAHLTDWIRKLSFPGNINRHWTEIKRESETVFLFVEEVKVEDELYLMYRDKEERLEFLNSLREAAIGRTPGEAFLSLDSSVMARSPEVYLIVEVNSQEESPIAREIREAWGNTGIGLSVVNGSDPGAINIIGLVYGFPLQSIREWEAVEDSFEQVYKEEGDSIYPFLIPGEEIR